jgi:HK97 family phage major capsid protein
VRLVLTGAGAGSTNARHEHQENAVTSTLAETKDLISSGRAELKQWTDRMTEITNKGFKRTDGGIEVEPGAAKEYKELVKKASVRREQLDDLAKGAEIKEWTDAPATRPQPGGAYQGPGAGGVSGAEYKSIGQLFVDSPEFKDRSPNGDMRGDFSLADRVLTEFGGVEVKDIHSGSIGTFTHPGFGKVDRLPPVVAPMRTMRVRDLFPQVSTSAVMVEYVEERGFVTPEDNAAATVAERTADDTNFGLKPKSNLRWETKSAPVKTIAHWVPAHRNTLDDEPALRGIIDTRLMYGLKLEEDWQILLGDGTGENLLGIMKQPGVQMYPGAGGYVDDDTYIDVLRRSITRIMLAEYEATGIVCHPNDWEKIELTKDANRNYVAVTAVTVGAEQRLWRTPVIATPAMPEGKALVGAYGLGAQIFDRMQGTIRTSEHHEDFFVRNAVVVLCEERVGLATYRPEAFIEVDLASLPAID